MLDSILSTVHIQIQIHRFVKMQCVCSVWHFLNFAADWLKRAVVEKNEADINANLFLFRAVPPTFFPTLQLLCLSSHIPWTLLSGGFTLPTILSTCLLEGFFFPFAWSSKLNKLVKKKNSMPCFVFSERKSEDGGVALGYSFNLIVNQTSTQAQLTGLIVGNWTTQ